MISKFDFYVYLAMLIGKLSSYLLICYDTCGKCVQKVTGVQGSHLKI